MVKFEEHELTITTDVTTGEGTVQIDGISIANVIERLSLDATAAEGRVSLGLRLGGATIDVTALALAVTAKVRLTGEVHRVLTALADQPSAASTEFIGAAECPTPQQILDLRLRENDSGADTVRGYLAALVEKVWDEGQSFSGKRPFGKSGWKGDFNRAFIEAGWVAGKLDVDPDGDWVDVDEVDDDHVDRLVRSAIKALADGDRD